MMTQMILCLWTWWSLQGWKASQAIIVLAVKLNQQHATVAKIKVSLCSFSYTFHGQISAKATIVASILQDEKEEKDSYQAGSYSVCKPEALKKFLEAPSQSINRNLPDFLEATNQTFNENLASEKCDFKIMDAESK